MEGGGGSDVQMADAAGSAGSEGNGANGAGSSAGRAVPVASGDKGSREGRSSAGNGRGMRSGGSHTRHPDEAEDKEVKLPLLARAGPSPIRRAYFSPPSFGTRDAMPVMSDDALMDAATNNRRVALVRIEQGHWGTPPGFLDILADAPDDSVDAVVAEVHGDANMETKARRVRRTMSWPMPTSWSVTDGRSMNSTCVFTLLRFCFLPTRWGRWKWRPRTSGVCVGLGQRPSSYRAVRPRSCQSPSLKRLVWRSSSRSLSIFIMRRNTP